MHRRTEFLQLQRHGIRYQTPHFVSYATVVPQARETRLGVTVSRRVGNAVVRNRIKRRVRECFRLTLRRILPAGTAIVVIARAGAGQAAGEVLRSELVEAATAIARRLGASR